MFLELPYASNRASIVVNTDHVSSIELLQQDGYGNESYSVAIYLLRTASDSKRYFFDFDTQEEALKFYNKLKHYLGAKSLDEDGQTYGAEQL